jgi:uncharacterized membrane protein HdeD (DUF308 family)
MADTPIASNAGAVPGWDRAATPVEREQPFPWWLLAILGVISILFGVAMLVWPDITLRVVGFFVGLWLLIAGIARVIGAFVSGRGVGAQILSGIIGVLLILGGVACLRNLVTSLAVLATIIALTWLFSGLSELVIGFAVRGPARGWLILLGVVSTLIGIAFVVWPGLSLATLVFMLSISAMIVGAGQLGFAFQVRKLTTTT